MLETSDGQPVSVGPAGELTVEATGVTPTLVGEPRRGAGPSQGPAGLSPPQRSPS